MTEQEINRWRLAPPPSPLRGHQWLRVPLPHNDSIVYDDRFGAADLKEPSRARLRECQVSSARLRVARATSNARICVKVRLKEADYCDEHNDRLLRVPRSSVRLFTNHLGEQQEFKSRMLTLMSLPASSNADTGFSGKPSETRPDCQVKEKREKKHEEDLINGRARSSEKPDLHCEHKTKKQDEVMSKRRRRVRIRTRIRTRRSTAISANLISGKKMTSTRKRRARTRALVLAAAGRRSKSSEWRWWQPAASRDRPVPALPLGVVLLLLLVLASQLPGGRTTTTTTTTTTPPKSARAQASRSPATSVNSEKQSTREPAAAAAAAELLTLNQTGGLADTANTKLTGHLRFEFQRYDGWYNNLANSEWGTPNTRLRRKVAPAYSDGVYQMSEEGRPGARLLSQRMMRGEDGQPSRRNLTTLFAFFGQVISSEILMASESGCPIEMHRIKIEKCDPMYDRDCRGGRTMPFYRAAYDPHTGQSPNLPREQLNRVTSWIDGSFIYSTSETWLNTMRSFDGRGTLKMVAKPQVGGDGAGTSPRQQAPAAGALGDAYLQDLVEALVADSAGQPPITPKQQVDLSQVPMALFGYPVRNKQRAPLINHMPAHHLQMKKAERMFLLGDARTNQNPMLLSFGILFYRWHNVLAERIYRQHPDWSDEEIFQRARRLVIASLQNIFLYEYLPILLDTPSPYAPPPPASAHSQIGTSRGLLGQTHELRFPGGSRAPSSSSSPLATGPLAISPKITTTTTTTTTTSELADNLETQYAKGQPLTDAQYDQNDLIRPYTGYKPDLHPGISHAFQSSAFRFGHTMIPPGLYLRDDKCRFLRTAQGFKGVRLCSTWWNAEEVVSKVGIEQLLMGAASQIAEREDYVLCNDVRDKLYGPLDFSRRDLAALNIMRGRDNGLADYNTVRQAFKLARINRWRDINPALHGRQPELFEELARLYGNRLDQVDLYIGGMLESDLERGRPGPLFRRIIKEQFERLRDSDRFWFENLDSGIFSESEVDEIRQIKLYDIIVNSTLIPDDAIQREMFRHNPGQGDPCPQPGQLSSSELQPCYIVKGHSYFKGNEQTYLLVCLTLVAIPIICALAAYCVVEYQDRKRRQFKSKQEYERNLLASRSAGSAGSKSATSGVAHLAGRAYQNSAFQEDKDKREEQGDDDEEEEEEEEEEEDDEQDEEEEEEEEEVETGDDQDDQTASDDSRNQLGSAGERTPEPRGSRSGYKAAAKCEKIYAKEWLHSNLKRKSKLRFGPEPDETIYVLDRRCQVQRKLDLSASDCASVVVELSASAGAIIPAIPAYAPLICGPPRHPMQASPSSVSLASSNGATSATGSQLTLATTSEAGVAAPRLQQLDAQAAAVASDYLDHHHHHHHRQQPHLLTADDLDRPVDHKPMVLIRVARQYDLVLQFSSVQHRRKFIFKLQAFLAKINKSMSLYQVQRDIMLANAETKEKRKQRLEQFFREAYALTFGLSSSSHAGAGTGPLAAQGGVPLPPPPGKVSPDIGMVMRTSLSREEFAEALGMRADSLFVKQMFNCIDKDRNGQISFQEFLDLVVRFSRGHSDDRLRIVFDMCDHNGRGLIEKRALIRVLRSLVDMAKTKSLSETQVHDMINEMFAAVGLDQKPLLDYDDFKLIINSSGRHLNVRDTLTGAPAAAAAAADTKLGADVGLQLPLSIGLDMKGAKKNFFADHAQETPPRRHEAGVAAAATNLDGNAGHAQSTGRRMTIAAGSARGGRKLVAASEPLGKGLLKRANIKWKALATDLEEHRQDIVYLVMFYVIVVVLFLERFVSYSFLSEHMDLRHVMGFGIAITRGSAASLSFCYALLLLSMCRNLMTWIRTMSVREYIPLDSHVKFHKIVAITALIMTILHTVGHCVNFYHVTQQPVEHLRCLTKEMQFSGESRPTFFYWVFQTVTGSTGLLLWILCSIVYVFAHAQVRQRAYSTFWSTHKLYYAIYALTLLHGSSKLTGSPRFWIFFIIPAILFTIDKIMSLQAKLWQLEIFETECLPSDVITVKFARPPSFKFLSGQWVRIACTSFRPHEFHAFTLTSAPQDGFLSVHVRAQGPWTWKLRNLFDPVNLQYNARPLHERLPPRIRIEGPFGGGNQDWYKYEVAVMIGGGIGVTPYASILNDLVFGTSTNRHSPVQYKKVYFIWICPSHRSFEWFIDVLRDVEKKDVTNLLEMHIFITQFFHKFDLRTTMLYICENHFQRISNKSLFTGLKAINHFGRPDIAALLQQVQNKHSRVSKVGVFSCGPKPLTKSVTEACEKVNQRRKLPFFLHQYENFS